MTGTILNAAGILLGGILGLVLRRPFSGQTQLLLKVFLGIMTVFVGLRMTFGSLGGGVGPTIKLLVIIVLSMTLGRLAGQGLRLQKNLNRLGQFAKKKIGETRPDSVNRLNDGFVTCTILFCAAPIAVLGAAQDGLGGQWETLGIKAVMDGLATMAFMTTFGWGAMLAIIPVVAYQGTLTLGARYLVPYLQEPGMMEAVSGTTGILVFSVSLIILEVKKVELADYLPSLVVAPLLAWLWF